MVKRILCLLWIHGSKEVWEDSLAKNKVKAGMSKRDEQVRRKTKIRFFRSLYCLTPFILSFGGITNVLGACLFLFSIIYTHTLFRSWKFYEYFNSSDGIFCKKSLKIKVLKSFFYIKVLELLLVINLHIISSFKRFR